MALRKVGGLWINEKKDGSKYMSGTVQENLPAGTKLMVFKNTYKEVGDKKPDYTLNVAEDDQPAPKDEYQQAPAGPPPADDIPFAPNKC